MKLEIVIPLWNEAANLPALLAMIGESPLVKEGTMRVLLVNNGSTDDTRATLDRFQGLAWVKIIHLPTNLNYGGGIVHGLRLAEAAYVGFIPGDMQVHIGDVEKIWAQVTMQGHPARSVFKGNRTVRADGANTRFVSSVYTCLANLILGIRVKDVNGLPKLFPRELVTLLPAEPVRTFVLDAQVLLTARRQSWEVEEFPVTFHARREGVSSWSGKRVRVYLQSIRLLWKLRAEPGS